MIEIIDPWETTPEESETVKQDEEKERPEWQEAFLRTFLAGH